MDTFHIWEELDEKLNGHSYIEEVKISSNNLTIYISNPLEKKIENLLFRYLVMEMSEISLSK